MKIKSLFFLFILAFFLTSPFSTVLADPVHVGTNLPYHIGTPDNPIVASEFCEFLNEKDHTLAHFQYTSKYYNASLKDVIEQKWVHKGWLSNGHFEYQVISGHENDIIDGVNDKNLQQEFNAWEKPREKARVLAQKQAEEEKAASEKAAAEKTAAEQALAAAKAAEEQAELAKNPTRAELRDVINYHLAALLEPSYLDKAQEIEQRYPDTAISHFLPAESLFDISKYDVEYGSKYNQMVGTAVRSETPTDYFVDGFYQITYFIPYDERSLWDQVKDFVDAANLNQNVPDSHLMMDENANFYTIVTHRNTSDKDLNHFLAYWGLQIAEENDPSLGLPAGMTKHVVLADQKEDQERQKWVMLIPLPNTQVSVEVVNGHDVHGYYDIYGVWHQNVPVTELILMPTSHYIIPVTETERKVYWKPTP